MSVRLCGVMTGGGPCVLPGGHNIGRADVPGNHSAALAPTAHEAIVRLLNDSGSYSSMEAIADAILAATEVLNVERLAEAIHAARKHPGTAEHAVEWDRLIARRALAYLAGVGA